MVAETPHVGSVLIARVAGLSVDVLDDLAAPRTLAALRESLHHQELAITLADQITDDLYEVVPALDNDRPIRHTAVSLRRDVHNGRWSRSISAAIESMLPRLPAPAADRLLAWARHSRGQRECLERAEELLDNEVRRAGEAMIAHLRTPVIASGLALASTEFTNQLFKGSVPTSLGSRFARSATAYLTRIATKTSPFSSLTTLGASTFVDALKEPPTSSPSAKPARVVSSARAHCVALLRAFARHQPAIDMLDLVVNTGLYSVGGQYLASLADYAALDGFCFRNDEITRCGLYDWVIPLLPKIPSRRAVLEASLGAENADPTLVGRLVEIGLLQPRLPWTLDTVAVFSSLASFVNQRAPRELVELTGAVDQLARCERIMSNNIDAARRADAIVSARDHLRTAYASIGQLMPGHLVDVQPFQEMVATDGDIAARLPANIRDDLAEAARWLAPLTVRDPRYARLVKCFVQRYGAGGVCRRSTDFLYAFLDQCGPFELIDPITSLDSVDPARLRGHRTLGHAGHVLFFQLAANKAEDLGAGNYQMVINLAHPGSLGLISRWARLPTVHERVGAMLRDWAHESHPGCRVYQMSAYPDWADIQRPTLATLPRLRCPGDLPDSEGAIDLSDIALTHDPASDTLQAYGQDGAPVAFSYLGAVPTHLLRGVPGLLCLLSDPWITFGRVDRDRRVVDDPDSGEITFQPRIVRGRLIWARARWSVPVDRLPQADRGTSALTFLTAVERWRAQLELPNELFVSSVIRTPTGVVRQKPRWLGFDHPHTVWTVLRGIQPEATTVDLVEALPARRQHWANNVSGHPVATEFLGLVRHA